MRRLWFMYAAVYLVLHAYLLRVIHLAYPGEKGILLAGAALCLAMLVVLVLSRVFESAAQYELARGLSFVGTPWLVLLTWFCVLAGAMDAWNLAIHKLGQSHPAEAGLLLPVRPTLGIILLIVSLAGLWSLIEAYRVRLKKVTFRTTRVSEPVRILQISDLHLNLLAGERRLRRIVRLIEKADPDMIVSTGDMVDGHVPRIERFARHMARMNPRLGKYAVLGNHDFYSGLPASLWFHEAAGFKVVRGECLTIEPGLRLVGVDDPVGNRMGQRCWSSEDHVLPPRSADAVDDPAEASAEGLEGGAGALRSSAFGPHARRPDFGRPRGADGLPHALGHESARRGIGRLRQPRHRHLGRADAPLLAAGGRAHPDRALRRRLITGPLRSLRSARPARATASARP